MQGKFGIREATGSGGSKGRQLERMNFIAAADAHVVWKNRLRRHVYGTSEEPLGAASLGQDDVCQLDTLLAGKACDSLLADHEFRRLRDQHDRFHMLSREVVAKLEAGEQAAALRLFENDYSAALCGLLQSLSLLSLYSQA